MPKKTVKKTSKPKRTSSRAKSSAKKVSQRSERYNRLPAVVALVVVAVAALSIMMANASTMGHFTAEVLEVDDRGFTVQNIFTGEVMQVYYNPRVRCRFGNRGVEIFPCNRNVVAPGSLKTIRGRFSMDGYSEEILVEDNNVRVGEIANLDPASGTFELLSYYPERVYLTQLDERAKIYVLRGRNSSVRSRGLVNSLRDGDLVMVSGDIHGDMITNARRVQVVSDPARLDLFYR